MQSIKFSFYAAFQIIYPYRIIFKFFQVMRKRNKVVLFIINIFSSLFLLQISTEALATEMYVGTNSVDITPKLPVALTGQFHLRIAQTIETPLSANILVIENRDGNKTEDIAIMVTCDVLYIPTDLIAQIRSEVSQLESDIDVSKIVLNATHTHTAPVLRDQVEYLVPEKGVTQVKDYRNFFSKQISNGIVAAWKKREPASVAWGLSYAVAGYNRRISYSDGTAGMSSNTNLPEFRNLEGSEDHDINTLFFWNKKNDLIATVIGVASPSQEVEGRSAVNADYWHPVREGIKKQYGENVCVLGWIGAAGDLTPHLRYRKAADDRMRELRGLDRMDEIARRIIMAVNESFETVKNDRHTSLKLVHYVETLNLPERLVTERDFQGATAFVTDAKNQIAADKSKADRLYRRMTWEEETIKRYNKQKTDLRPQYPMELHVIRLGDVAICTNEFELFSDFGIRMQARSKALQTFIVQLAGSPEWGAYLPTEKAVNGGAYSAVIHSSRIGPEGGQVLVEKTVEVINSLWP